MDPAIRALAAASEVVDEARCTCVPAADSVALTGGCPVHDPVLRMLRGEPVKFAGFPQVTEADPDISGG